jgi:acyl-CoA reductase-like NAD-dependent aldehyde dehydrogenase
VSSRKSPNIVFEDADLDAAVNGVISGIFAAVGQTCVAGSRHLVHERVHETSMKKLVARTRRIRIGDPMNPDTEMGTVAFKEHLEKIERYIKLGVSEGATVACGGRRPDDPALSRGLFIEPTILENVDSHFRVAQEEIFGPVLCAMKFKDEEECVEVANDVEFGLAAGIWTKDIQRAHRIARRLRAGTVWINYYRSIAPCIPFGGYECSGFGRENGIEAINDYTQVKSVWVEVSGRTKDPFN